MLSCDGSPFAHRKTSSAFNKSSTAISGSHRLPLQKIMEGTIKIALIGAGMFGGDVHARAYADLQRAGISSQLGRVGLDKWTRDFAPIKFELVAVATRSEKSAKPALHIPL